MGSLWPWLVIAGVGALHGLNPATGWMWAAAWGVRSRDRSRAAWALVPIALGHAASVALVAAAVALGLSMDRVLLQAVAGGLLIVVALLHLWGRMPQRARAPAGHAGLALWSFMMSSAHGAGLMLVPALVPLCLGDASTPEISTSDSLMLALAAVAIHTAAMLAVTGVIATGICRSFDAGARWLLRPSSRLYPNPVAGSAFPSPEPHAAREGPRALQPDA
ncbi:hypothetical protein [Variovorax sp. DT-64]|uniref:hypothetical protein n=1 Tax=Variovorax sp. DT-64 TaxID=3396160 RepID=UPI003F1DB928